MALAPGMKLGPYEILAPLGAGGMGEVYRARDPRLNREVAVKVLPEEFLEGEERRARFEREARLLASVNHPGVAAIHSFEEIPGSSLSDSRTRHVLVMELLEGENLRERLRAGPLPVRKALDVAAQMADALAAAHEKGIVHRDLKPENVFLTKGERVKLLDFGLAKTLRGGGLGSLTQTATESALSEAGAVMGTVGYMSPEQVRGEPVDHRSDFFSFGTILYELLTGKNPFRRDTPPETLTAILKEEPPLLSETEKPVPQALSRIVARCLEKRAEARFQGAADLAFGLETLTSASVSPAAAPAPGLARRRRTPGWRTAAAAASMLLALAGSYFLGSRRPSSTPPSFTRLTFRRGYVDGARFAPDGQTILYGATWEGGPVQVYSARIGNPETSPVASVAMLLGVSRTGELALLQKPSYSFWSWEGTLARAPLSGGAPREVLEEVSEADFSPDGSELAVGLLTESESRLELPPGTPLYTSEGRVAQPRFSRDGRRIAFIDHPRPFGGGGDVAVIDRGGRKTVLSKGWRSLRGLAWSPRGDEVWFTGSRTSLDQSLHAVSLSGEERVVARWGGNWNLHDVSPDGRALLTEGSWRRTAELSSPAGTRDLSWFDHTDVTGMSLDGEQIVFVEGGEGVRGRPVAYLRPTDGSPAVRLGEGVPFKLLRDKKWALVWRDKADPEFVLLPTGPGVERALPAGLKIKRFRFDFFPDGKRILFQGEGWEGRRGLWVQDLDGGPPRPFGPAGLDFPSISPDGTFVAAIPGPSTLQILTAAGEVRRTITLPTDSSPRGWVADGRSLWVLKRGERLTVRVDQLDLATGVSRFWREIRPQDPAGVVTGPTNTLLTPDGRSIVSTYLRNLTNFYLVEGLR